MHPFDLEAMEDRLQRHLAAEAVDCGTMKLTHFTCRDHGQPGIERAQEIQPRPQPLLGGAPLVWLTDDPGLPAYALGLQSTVLVCDRTAVRYDVVTASAEPWKAWIQRHPGLMSAASKLEFGRSPRHWFVSESPIPVRTEARHQDRVRPVAVVGPATPVTETVRMTGGGGGALTGYPLDLDGLDDGGPR